VDAPMIAIDRGLKNRLRSVVAMSNTSAS
jgi:hypothetical protein